MSNEAAVAKRPSYGEADVRRALIEVAACSGNTHMAARNLKADDNAPSVEQKTLWEWANRRHVETYEKLRQEALPAITAQAAEQHMALARRQSEVSATALEEISKRLPEMEDKDLINAMGKADIGSGIHTEKAQLLSGQPTHIHKRSAAEVLRELEAEGVKLIDAEVVSEEDVVVPADVPAPPSEPLP